MTNYPGNTGLRVLLRGGVAHMHLLKHDCTVLVAHCGTCYG